MVLYPHNLLEYRYTNRKKIVQALDKKAIGVVLYFGEHLLYFEDKFWAVPMRVFF